MLIYIHIIILYGLKAGKGAVEARDCDAQLAAGFFLKEGRILRFVTYNYSTPMDQQQQAPPAAPRVPILYVVETVFKALFLVMSIFNLKYTLIVAFTASLAGLLRVCKTPQFNKEYLAKAMLNNHGQNLLYISIGSLGFINYLYYAPIVIFFAYGIL